MTHLITRLFTTATRALATSTQPLPLTRLSHFPTKVQHEAAHLLTIASKAAATQGIQAPFATAQAWLLDSEFFKNPPQKIASKATYRAYASLSYLMNLVIQRYYEGIINTKAASLTKITQTVIAPVLTRHPCCPTPEVYPLLGQLMGCIEQKRWEDAEPLIHALLKFDSSIPNMTLQREIQLNLPLIEHLLGAGVQYEITHNLLPRSVIRPQNWGGYDGDRTPVTAEVVLATKIIETQYALQLYQKHCTQMLSEERLPSSFKHYLVSLQKILSETETTFKPVWRLVKTKAIIYAQAFAPGEPLLRHTVHQFFIDGSASIPTFIEGTDELFRSWGRTLSTDPTLACHQLDQEIKTIFQLVFSKKKACLQGIQILQREAAKSDVPLTTKRSTQTLYHLFQNAGFHLTEGQGRLGSEAILPACHELMEQDGFSAIDDFEDSFFHAIDVYAERPLCTLEELSKCSGDTQTVIKYFQSMTFLNSIDSRNMPYLILANFTGPSCFLSAFYLAVRMGLITVRKNKVVDSHIVLVPLAERPEDHFQMATWFDTLCSHPLIKSYYACTMEWVWMTAFSDTPRERGMMEALVSIEVATHEVHDVFKRQFPDLFRMMLYRHQLGRGSSGLRSGELGIDLITRRHPVAHTVLSRTLQSGESDDAFSTPERASIWLEQELKLPKTYAPYDKKWMCFLRQFTKPGADAFEKIMTDPTGRMNQFLIKLKETDYVINHSPMGSRKNPPMSLFQLPTALIVGQRMISIVRLLANELHLYVHAFIPLVHSMQVYLQNGGQLSELQRCYHEHVFFQRLVSKLEELLYFSNETALQHYRELDPELVDELIQQTHLAKEYVLTISGQTRLLEKRPELELIWTWRNEQAARAAILKRTLYPKAGLFNLHAPSAEERRIRTDIQHVDGPSLFGRYA